MTQTPVAPVSTGLEDGVTASPPEAADAPRMHGLTTRPRPHRSRIAAYVALTKPRIIELLLVTTLPSMVLAAHGLPRWTIALVTMLGGTLAAGSANALNCYLDRDIDAIMRRTGRRPLARHEVSPTGALVFGLLLGAVSVAAIGLVTNWLAGGADARGDRVLHRRLHDVAQAAHRAEHRLGRRRGLHARADRLDGRDRLAGRRAVRAVRGRLLLDSAAHVGAGHPLPRGLRACRRADAAGSRRPRVGSRSRSSIYTWLTVAASLALWPLATGWVYGLLASLAGAVLIGAAHRLLHATTRETRGAIAKPMQFFHLSNSYLAFVFVAVALDTFVR